jgi:flagellar basal body rod protein FlgG
MTPGIYSTVSALNARWAQQDISAKNISSVNTVGNKRQVSSFESILKHSLEKGLPPSVTTLNRGQEPTFNLEMGSLQATHQPLDAALINKYDFFQIQTPSGTRLTRSGHFTVNVNREVVNDAGYPVLNSSGEKIILPTNGAAAFQPDGSITVEGQPSQQKLGIMTLDEKDVAKLESEGGSIFSAEKATLTQNNSLSLLKTGHLESSNVDMPSEMVQMIQNQRMFDMLTRTLQIQDDGLGKAIQDLSGTT